MCGTESPPAAKISSPFRTQGRGYVLAAVSLRSLQQGDPSSQRCSPPSETDLIDLNLRPLKEKETWSGAKPQSMAPGCSPRTRRSEICQHYAKAFELRRSSFY
jgi:hypothetical protein